MREMLSSKHITGADVNSSDPKKSSRGSRVHSRRNLSGDRADLEAADPIMLYDKEDKTAPENQRHKLPQFLADFLANENINLNI